MEEGLLGIISATCDQLVKSLITLELHGVFESNFGYLFILTLPSHQYANGNEAFSSIIWAEWGLLVKMLMTLEPQHTVYVG